MVPGGGQLPADFYVLKAPEWVHAIALTDDEQIVLVEQYRHGIDTVTLEIPGGMTDSGEDPAEAAKRELLEETGYSSESWQFLGKVSSNPAILTNYTHLYLAENCTKTASQHMDGHEDIKLHTMPIQTFLSHVKDGVVHHSIVVAAVSKLLLKYPELLKTEEEK